MKHILHIVDDEKFIDAAINSFKEIDSYGNSFILLNNGTTRRELNYIKNTENIEVFDFYKKDEIYEFIINKKITAIAIHYLSSDKLNFCIALKLRFPELKFVWFFWGADGYGLPKLKYNLYQKSTNKLVRKLTKSRLKKIAFLSFELLDKIGLYPEHLLRSIKLKRSFIKQIDFIVPVIPEDFRLLKSHYALKAQMIEWNYLSIEHMLSSNVDVRVKGTNILLGNSADPCNNHIEIIDVLSVKDLKDRKVFVPLSYGDADYRDAIIEYGQKKLGANFVPLTDFMPLKEYTDIISSCNYVIMNHNRQQAMGNIFVALYMGAKLFINKNSTMFDFIKRNTISFYEISDLDKDFDTALKPISIADQQKNRALLYKIMGKEIIKEKTKGIIDILLNE